METVDINERYAADITQMRQAGAYGATNEELMDGNMIPRLCEFAGKGACQEACQLKELKKSEPATGSEDANKVESVGKLCAEKNILDELASLYVHPEKFVMVSATKDRVIFGDEIDESGAIQHPDGYTIVPEANGFYFRPDIDMTLNGHRQIHKAAMRMADCGDVIVDGTDKRRELFGDRSFIGQGHFSRTNMRGPSAYMHELNGKKVSWGEYFIGNGIEHYEADASELQVTLVAAVEGKDFLHYYENDEQRDAHFPGWNELGFMHYTGNVVDGKKECLINYREMIVWQLTEGIQNPKYRLQSEQIHFEKAINTGDKNLGHASHHMASHGDIAHGRDMYLAGFNKRETVRTRTIELGILQEGREQTIGWLSDDEALVYEKLIAAGDKELAQLETAWRELNK